jgi:hypothetical protein
MAPTSLKQAAGEQYWPAAYGRLYAFSGDHRNLSFEADHCTDGSFYGDLLVKPL